MDWWRETKEYLSIDCFYLQKTIMLLDAQGDIDKEKQDKVEKSEQAEYIPANMGNKEWQENKQSIEEEFQREIDLVYRSEENEGELKLLKRYEEFILKNKSLLDSYKEISEKHLPKDLHIDFMLFKNVIINWTQEQRQEFIKNNIDPGLNHIYRNVTGRFVMRWLSSLFSSTRVDTNVIALQELYIDAKRMLK